MQRCEKKFARIFESGKYLDLLELSDSNIRTDDGCNFAIHRVILARSSDYFRRMFLGMGKRRRKFRIPGISGECLSEILRYIYTEKIQVTERNMIDLIIGADYLLVEDLKNKIKRKIEGNLTYANCFRVLLAAHRIGDECTFGKCFRFIQMKFQWTMQCQNDELADLPLEILKRILSNRSLYVYNETTVWEAIVAWTQKDIPSRMACVPQLLLTLATEDVGEELATKILQHKIISENCYMNDLVEITSSNDSTTNLLTFLNNYSYRFTEPIIRHRLPHQLFVKCDYADYEDSYDFEDRSDEEKCLYITYDDNTDFGREIAQLSCSPDALIAIRHNIYVFDMKSNICMNFDLSAMNWVRMKRFRNDYSLFDKPYILAADRYIYVLDSCSVEVYDTVSNRWNKGVPLRKISLLAAVVFENKIYVVGNTKRNGMTMQMFDSETQMWSNMSPPHVNCGGDIDATLSLVAYHQKMYLIGGSDAEVFDPAANLWNELPTLLDLFRPYCSPKAMVIHDQIIVATFELYVRWNNADECWEEFEKSDTISDIFLFTSSFCSIDDSETIRMITEQNRDPNTQWKYKKFIK